MKTCPFCAEEIQSDAIKCRYCGELLNNTKAPNVMDSEDATSVNPQNNHATSELNPSFFTKTNKYERLHKKNLALRWFMVLAGSFVAILFYGLIISNLLIALIKFIFYFVVVAIICTLINLFRKRKIPNVAYRSVSGAVIILASEIILISVGIFRLRSY